jgi:hypothetical protein
MNRDYGAGLTVDELIGMTAYQIMHLALPPGEIFQKSRQAAQVMVDHNLESYLLTELWEDGHSVWRSIRGQNQVRVDPRGQLIQIPPADHPL